MKIFQSLALLATTALLFSACKRTELIKPLDGRGQTIVRFANTYNLLPLNVQTASQSVEIADIRRDAPNEGELNKSITVVVKEDTAALTTYNIKNGINLVRLPANLFSWDGANMPVAGQFNITFQPGEFAKALRITVPNTSLFDFNTRYGLAFTMIVPITGAEGRVSFENRTLIVEVAVKNPYDGLYTLNGYFVHPTAAYVGGFVRDDIELRTTGPNSVVMFWRGAGTLAHPFSNAGSLTYFGNQSPVFTINPTTNKVTVSNSYTGATDVVYEMDPAYDSRYEPATRTIYAKYGYSTFSRVYTDTLKWMGPR